MQPHKLLRAARKERGLRLDDLVDALAGTDAPRTKSSLSQYELGRYKPPRAVLDCYAMGLDHETARKLYEAYDLVVYMSASK